MKSFSIIEVSDPRWAEIVSSAYLYDFYHTNSYSKLERVHRPILCVAFSDNDFIAIPLLVREIEGTDFFDCTSVYGYCGPISNLPFEFLSKELILFFQSEILSFFRENNYVSIFSRLHPILNQLPVLEKFGIIREINKTVCIDLTIPEDEQYGKYRKNHRKDIEKLRNNGFIVFESSLRSELDLFIQNYYDLMERIKANESYFFEKEYFYSMLDNPCFKTKLLIIKKDGEFAGGALFTFTKNIIQTHLSCDNIEFRNYSPLKLVIDHARHLGNELNMKFLHLGGGKHGSSDDSLYHFKAGFSDNLLVYSGWQLIIDQSKYDYLINLFNIDIPKTSNYFPSYRAR